MDMETNNMRSLIHEAIHAEHLKEVYKSAALNQAIPALFHDPEELQEMGNKLYEAGDYLYAISAYTKSLARAPPGSELRGLAYANRSAALLALGYYEECISDAKIALENNYPENLAQKVHSRIAFCKKALGKEATEDVDSEASEKPADKVKPKVQKVGVEYAKLPELLCGPHPNDPMISAALTMNGNSLFANKRINVGDVLMVEPPLIFEPSSKESRGQPPWTYCSECLKFCCNLKPCSTCSWACYCSEECASVAWNSYHKNECSPKNNVVESFIQDDLATDCAGKILNANVLFKIISTFGLEKCIKALNPAGGITDETPDEMQMFLKLATYDGSAFGECAEVQAVIKIVAESFCGLSVGKKRALKKFLTRAITVFRDNQRCYDELRLFETKDGFCVNDWFIGSTAVGIFPRIASLKPSCDPNINYSQYQKVFVVQAARPIQAGEEITIHKGVSFRYHPLQTRRALQAYSQGRTFFCNCQACVENWVLLKDQVDCHMFVEEIPAYEKLKSEFQCKVLDVVQQPLVPLSVFTPENLALCTQIIDLYGNNRRDDKQCAGIEKFVRVYFEAISRNFSFGESSSLNQHHYIPHKILSDEPTQ
ncbi:uncharacterized protein LOC132192451 [Neocloeon triangulifer]|uniref:uncharacterized protein LOC132192451 n=1 Tax=Neocloeon triangulifer TaxID=2078957 RepID=UPI00286F806D|nr:uncharacterized protein LOC132192451 [Neocloeon triangulifer]XP_059468404.1 uncharacterized protein LOC132192451 [Neocloeon triangulifer]